MEFGVRATVNLGRYSDERHVQIIDANNTFFSIRTHKENVRYSFYCMSLIAEDAEIRLMKPAKDEAEGLTLFVPAKITYPWDELPHLTYEELLQFAETLCRDSPKVQAAVAQIEIAAGYRPEVLRDLTGF